MSQFRLTQVSDTHLAPRFTTLTENFHRVSDAEGIVLVACPVFAREIAAPQRRIDFGDSRTSGRDVPAIKGPEMNAGAEALTDEP